MGGIFSPPQEPLHGPLGSGLIDAVSERLRGGGGSKRASRRALHARMQTVCPSFHDPLCAYPWPSCLFQREMRSRIHCFLHVGSDSWLEVGPSAHVGQLHWWRAIRPSQNRRSLTQIQCGQRYYASSFFRDFQDVFHDIIPGIIWKVSSVISRSYTISE